MDRNSITGVILIVLIVIGYNALYPPVVNVENDKSPTNNKTITIEEEEEEQKSQIQENEIFVSDSSRLNLKYGVFAKSANGSNEDILIENDLLKLSISPKGGRIVSAIPLITIQSQDLPVITVTSKTGTGAFIKPVITSTEGLCVANIKCIPEALAF